MTSAIQTVQTQQQAPTTGSLAMVATLAVISLVSGLLLAIVYQGTLDKIARNNEDRTRAAVRELLPGTENQKIFTISTTGNNGEAIAQNIYAGYDDSGTLIGVALEAVDNGGYGGEIRLLYGYLPDQEKVCGMKVLLSKETPGLGDRIKTDPVFQANFDGLDVALDEDAKNLKHPVAFSKPGSAKGPGKIEGISGATISSKAVARAMNTSTNALLPIVHDMLDELKEGGK